VERRRTLSSEFVVIVITPYRPVHLVVVHLKLIREGASCIAIFFELIERYVDASREPPQTFFAVCIFDSACVCSYLPFRCIYASYDLFAFFDCLLVFDVVSRYCLCHCFLLLAFRRLLIWNGDSSAFLPMIFPWATLRSCSNIAASLLASSSRAFRHSRADSREIICCAPTIIIFGPHPSRNIFRQDDMEMLPCASRNCLAV